MTNSTPTEYQECLLFVEYLEIRNLRFSHIPQETFTKSWGVKKKNSMMGVRRGVPDYIVITPKGLLFIEMKRTKGGQVSKKQQEWIDELNECDGVEAKICYGATEAISFVEEYI